MYLWSHAEWPNNFMPILTLTFLCTIYAFNLEPIGFFLKISYLTGQILVGNFLEICQRAAEIYTSIFSVMQIVYEDALIFIEDAREIFLFGVSLLEDLYLIFLSKLAMAQALGQFFLISILRILQLMCGVLFFACSAILAIKQSLQFLGLFVWVSFISIPEKVITNVNSFFEFIRNSKDELANEILQFTEKVFRIFKHYFTSFCNVEFESVYGLVIITVFLVTLYLKFSDLTAVIRCVISEVFDAVSFAIIWCASKFMKIGNTQSVTLNQYQPENDDMLCVVCQINSKEVVILPCKHLCLCQDCSFALSAYQRICPICRSRFKETIKVYI